MQRQHVAVYYLKLQQVVRFEATSIKGASPELDSYFQGYGSMLHH